MLSLSDPGDLFRSLAELESKNENGVWVRLYSGKTIHQFNHRYSSFENGAWREVSLDELQDTDMSVKTEYYVQKNEVEKRTTGKNLTNG